MFQAIFSYNCVDSFQERLVAITQPSLYSIGGYTHDLTSGFPTYFPFVLLLYILMLLLFQVTHCTKHAKSKSAHDETILEANI